MNEKEMTKHAEFLHTTIINKFRLRVRIIAIVCVCCVCV